MGPPDSLVLPAFFFQKSANAPTGYFDLVLAGNKPQYVAKAANGGVVLTSASTGATAKNVNGQSIVTSISTVDCKGCFGVEQGNTAYTWDISANGQSTTLTTGTASLNRTMVAYSLQMKTKPTSTPGL
ncbi:hypothetical protein CLAFUW4_13084 [Fulvia fulva]|uniref:Uncharacterized protein n=1 Tax=Passalora fulva TaxID=5499 RepID=A0A9Q8PK45_PASFU|nr:uncharacterized protein CLAFUR5_12942 [Fulvia fulva]KAK4612187.1 hypothetical protein CLAFUR4_13088 [Fulvia fulva]KAK4613039.1 hypothetical protein CLAFUR0_13092 [Fulvia fulva]UJO24119.1 hypothetical protein CLAFUR5_12942 [Fulvia fulva]WPV21233.1 hypothetical protein CLAFUW4_13084 [Fulvia fulva]WPV36093.1 hypothetical protein CLAFUW7_13091 [Fulvia fulva]